MGANKQRGGAKNALALPLNGKLPQAPTVRHSPQQNHLLDALPPSDFDRLAPHLELIR